MQQSGQNHHMNNKANNKKRTSRVISRIVPSKHSVVVMCTELVINDRPSFMLTCR